MIRDEIKDNIYIDYDCMDFFDGCTDFGYDQAYDSFPCVFPTACVKLGSCYGLDALADELRKKEGELPFFDDSGDYDYDGWYDFYINLNGYNNHHVDTCIFARAYNDSGDYYIDLSDDEQEYVYQCLNEEIDCEQLLKDCVAYFADEKELTILDRKCDKIIERS